MDAIFLVPGPILDSYYAYGMQRTSSSWRCCSACGLRYYFVWMDIIDVLLLGLDDWMDIHRFHE